MENIAKNPQKHTIIIEKRSTPTIIGRAAERNPEYSGE